MAILTEEEREIDPYEVLGLTPEASEKDVRKAYRKKSLKCHPDKVGVVRGSPVSSHMSMHLHEFGQR